MMRAAFLFPLALLAAACGGAGGGGRPQSGQPAILSGAGIDTVMGQNAAGLARLFGTPDADMREGTARKLRFTSAICVLDTYLYPRSGNDEPRVTWMDARQRDGSPIDRASCIAALTRRDGGK